MSSWQDPLIVELMRTLLKKGEKIFFHNIFGEWKEITGFGYSTIDTQVPVRYSGRAVDVAMKGGPGITIMPPTADDYDLRKREDGTWELYHIETKKRLMREDSGMPLIGGLVKQKLAKGTDVTINIDLNDLDGPLFRHQARAHLGDIRGVSYEPDPEQLNASGDGAYVGDEGRPLLVFHYLLDKELQKDPHSMHMSNGWVAIYADEADDKLDLLKTSYGWQLTNRVNEAMDDIIPIELMVQHLLDKGERVMWGINSVERITSLYREPGAKMLKVNYDVESPHGTWGASQMLSSLDQDKLELRKIDDYFALYLPS